MQWPAHPPLCYAHEDAAVAPDHGSHKHTLGMHALTQRHSGRAMSGGTALAKAPATCGPCRQKVGSNLVWKHTSGHATCIASMSPGPYMASCWWCAAGDTRYWLRKVPLCTAAARCCSLESLWTNQSNERPAPDVLPQSLPAHAHRASRACMQRLLLPLCLHLRLRTSAWLYLTMPAARCIATSQCSTRAHYAMLSRQHA